LPSHQFEHLPLILRNTGPARLTGGGEADPATLANRENRGAHSGGLVSGATTISDEWRTQQQKRSEESLPDIEGGIPLLLKVDPELDLDEIRKRFKFEVVAEQEDGFVIVASADISLATFREIVEQFAAGVRGSATVAKVHELRHDPTQQERLSRILSPALMEHWGAIADKELYIVDFGVSCVGDWQVPNRPKRGRRTDDVWAKVEAEWSNERENAYAKWDELREQRLEAAEAIFTAYGSEILGNYDGARFDAPTLPDSFTLRVKLPGAALRDFVLNYPYLFEVTEPDDIETPQGIRQEEVKAAAARGLNPPHETAPAVCVIDSGIQEEHIWLEPAIDKRSSHCFLLGKLTTEIADEVKPSGHGTRVAGAVLHGEHEASDHPIELDAWIQNARVLDEDCKLPETMLPAAVMRDVVKHFHEGPRKTRIFNHSFNGTVPCRMKHMSSWAAEIDALSNEFDVLVIQSAGNIPSSGTAPNIGLKELLANGQVYPDYFSSALCRISNPAQSLQALTVGSVAYDAFRDLDWNSFSSQTGDSSGFSRTGLGIWETIKPEVVEFGGDELISSAQPTVISTPPIAAACYPQLTRSTLHGGPAVARDEVGTSFAAPKVTKIAARVARVLPSESALMYRALIVQSAQWPGWAEKLSPEQKAALIKRIGYGIPDIERASTNTDYRTTFLSGSNAICAGDCHVYQVPIPDALRRPADEFDIRVDVTLSYAALPRRTRRRHRGYLATWVDWVSNRRGESREAFLTRALREGTFIQDEGSSFGWTIEARSDWGQIPSVPRGIGTLQKDWALLKSNALPEDFCIAVRGHRGWSNDPDSSASYALTVTLEIVGKEIQIYEPLRTAVNELQAELGVEDLELEVSEM
jgi:hypothetical protein